MWRKKGYIIFYRTLRSRAQRTAKFFIFRRKTRKIKQCMLFGQINSSPQVTPDNIVFLRVSWRAWRFSIFYIARFSRVSVLSGIIR